MTVVIRSFIYSLLLISNTLATVFVPQPFEVQVEEADAIVEGRYVGQNYKRIFGKKIVTELYIEVDKMVGLNPNQVYNSQSLKVIMPGGEWQGEVHRISGTPKFKMNEEVILMLKKSSYGLVLHGLASGKYQVVTEDKVKYLVSEIFKGHATYSKIPYQKFNELVQVKFNTGLNPRASSKTIYFKPKKNIMTGGRSLASINESDEARSPANQEIEQSKSNDTFWIALILGFLGAFYVWVTKNNKHDKEQ